MRTTFPAIVGAVALLLSALPFARGAGVTIITHGANGNGAGWINPMAQQITSYVSFPGSASSYYEITVEIDFFHDLVVTQTKLGGVNPTNSDSGEILIFLDWSAPGFDPFFSTTDIAESVVPTLLRGDFIPELDGRALVELPIHLIGHSRGGSLITKLAELLGNQGIWVDHITTLDPHPVPEVGDPDVEVFANVLFADNYWQTNPITECPNGQSVTGAYNRYLTNLVNGDSCNHGDVHFWYHGTIDWSHAPITVDGSTITSGERGTWWTGYESRGRVAGFIYSLIGGSNRLSADEPADAGNGRVRDGLNQMWDFGAGAISNRRALAANNASWPNLIKLDFETARTVIQGDPVSLKYFFQSGLTVSETALVQVRLDNDANPYDGDVGEVFQVTESGTGTTAVGERRFAFETTNTPPGEYYVHAKITAGGRTRYLPASGKFVVKSPTALAIVQSGIDVVVTWPTNAVGFVLESTGVLLTPWSTVTTTPVIINGQNTVTNTTGNGNEFFRLKK
jgi:hypothetical protein